MNQDIPEFNIYEPNFVQKSLIKWSRANDKRKFGKFIASIARRIVRLLGKPPFDIETWGLKMRLDPTRNVAEKRLIFAPNRFDSIERDVLANALNEGDIFLDIGANIGGYSLWAAKWVGQKGQVLAFEPQPNVFARLKSNIDLNPELNILPMQIALGYERGKMRLSINSSNDGEGSLAKIEQGGGSIEVEVWPLLEILNQQNITSVKAIKIDVEGFEENVLLPFFNDAPNSIWPQTIILERGDGEWKSDLKAKIIEFGYNLKLITRMNYILERK